MLCREIYVVYWCNFSLISDTELCSFFNAIICGCVSHKFLSLISKSFEGWPFLSSICFFVSCYISWQLHQQGSVGFLNTWKLFGTFLQFLQWFYFISHAFEIPFSVHFLFSTEPFKMVLWFIANCNAVVCSLENLWNCVPLEQRTEY